MRGRRNGGDSEEVADGARATQFTIHSNDNKKKCVVTRHDASPPREPRNGLAFLDARHQFYITHGLKLAERTSKHPIREKMEGLGARIRSVLSQQMVLPSRGARRTDRQAR